MSSTQWSVLIAGKHVTLNPAIEHLFQRSNIMVDRVEPASQGLNRAQEIHYDLVILELPLEDPGLGNFVKALRGPGSASRTAGLLVTGETSEHEAAALFLGRGINRFVPRDGNGSTWLDAVASLIAVPPRSSLRALVQLETAIRGSRSRMLAQTENLSETGMLIRGDTRHFKPGDTIEFELILPGEETPIRGTAKVVRPTIKEREGIEGFAAQFLTLENGGLAILQAFLRHVGPHASTAGAAPPKV